MKFKFGLYFLLPFISAVAFNTSFAQNKEPDKTFSAAQEKRIGEIAADYLRAHPEILIQHKPPRWNTESATHSSSISAPLPTEH